MKRFALLACTAASLLLAAACKKDQTTPQPLTPGQLLADKTWVMTAATVDPGLPTSAGTTVTNVYPFVPACTLNDTQQFVTGGVYKFDEGLTKCDPSDPQTVTGSWALAQSGSNLALTILANGGSLHFNVLSLTDTQLQVSTQEDVFGFGTTANTYTLTYTKK